MLPPPVLLHISSLLIPIPTNLFKKCILLNLLTSIILIFTFYLSIVPFFSQATISLINIRSSDKMIHRMSKSRDGFRGNWEMQSWFISIWVNWVIWWKMTTDKTKEKGGREDSTLRITNVDKEKRGWFINSYRNGPANEKPAYKRTEWGRKAWIIYLFFFFLLSSRP